MTSAHNERGDVPAFEYPMARGAGKSLRLPAELWAPPMPKLFVGQSTFRWIYNREQTNCLLACEKVWDQLGKSYRTLTFGRLKLPDSRATERHGREG